MREQMTFDFQVDPSPAAPMIAELAKAGIASIEEGIQCAREASTLNTEEYNAAATRLANMERYDELTNRVPRDPDKFRRQRWKRIRELGLPFFCFLRLQGVSRSTRSFLFSEYKKRFQPKEGK